MIPAWLPDEAWRPIHPPAEVLVLGELPRAPEKYLAALRALQVTTAKRFQPEIVGEHAVTKCNVALSDGCQILNAPIPHRFDLGDGERELTANDIFDGLAARKFAGWYAIGSWASAKAASAHAAEGKPTIAVWRNWQQKRTEQGAPLVFNGRKLYRPGHVGFVVPAPNGLTGVFVTAAGAHCVQDCPIELSFGPYTKEVMFYGHP